MAHAGRDKEISLEMAGDVVQSLRVMERVMRAIEAFLN
jgi:hypothetical protein